MFAQRGERGVGRRTNRRPAAAATSRRNARLKPSDSSEPCQWVPQVRRPGSRPRRAHRLSLRRPRGGSRRPRPVPRGPRRRAGSGSSPGEPHPDGQHPEPRPGPRRSRRRPRCARRGAGSRRRCRGSAALGGPADQSLRETAPQPLQGTDGAPGAGTTTRSASASSSGRSTNRTTTPGSAARASTSVKLDISAGMTRSTSSPTGEETSDSRTAPRRDPQFVLLVDAEAVPEGRTPYVRRPVRSCSMSRPGSRSETSPRNLLTRNRRPAPGPPGQQRDGPEEGEDAAAVAGRRAPAARHCGRRPC